MSGNARATAIHSGDSPRICAPTAAATAVTTRGPASGPPVLERCTIASIPVKAASVVVTSSAFGFTAPIRKSSVGVVATPTAASTRAGRRAAANAKLTANARNNDVTIALTVRMA
jgi:hypothetical protein